MQIVTAAGRALELLTLRSHSLVDGVLAFTEVELSFRTPAETEHAVRFDFDLPPSASLTRFSTRFDSTWVEAEVVEKHDGYSVYGDELRIPPGLAATQTALPRFSKRVLVAAGHSTQRIRFSYVQELRGPRPVLLPLRALPVLQRIQIKVREVGNQRALQQFDLESSRPPDAISLGALAQSAALRDESRVAARWKAPVLVGTEPIESLLIMVDTSRSEWEGFPARIERLEELVASLGIRSPQSKVGLLAFDQSIEMLGEAPAARGLRSGFEALRRRRCAGASRLSALLQFLGASNGGAGYHRLLLVTAGRFAGYDDSPRELSRLLTRLAARGVRRLDVWSDRQPFQPLLLTKVVGASALRPGSVVEGVESGAALHALLETRVHRRLLISVPGASWYFPHELTGIRAGEDVTVYAKLGARQPLRISAGGVEIRPPSAAPGTQQLLPWALAKAEVDELLTSPTNQRQRALELSLQQRVLGPLTTLVELDSPDDYRRFGFTRPSLPGIVDLTASGVAIEQRENPYKSVFEGPARAPVTSCGWVNPGPWFRSGRDAGPLVTDLVWERPEPTIEAAKALETAEADDAPAVTPVEPDPLPGRMSDKERSTNLSWTEPWDWVSGRIPPEVIQHVIHLNYGRFRGCYQAGLLKNPKLRGRVRVRFVIRGDGQLAQAFDDGSTLADRGVTECIVRQFWELTFPTTIWGDTITVVYPLLLAPARDGGLPTIEEDSPEIASTREPIPLSAEQAHPEWPRASEVLSGRYAEIVELLEAHRPRSALLQAKRWIEEAAMAPLAWIAQGDAALAATDLPTAERAFGSLVDLYPTNPAILRYVALRLQHLGSTAAHTLAIQLLRRATQLAPTEARNDHLLAVALAREGKYEAAFERAEQAAKRLRAKEEPSERGMLFADLSVFGAAWAKTEPRKRASIEARSAALGIPLEAGPSVRFELSWTTSDSEVDLHVYTEDGQHVYPARPALSTVGELLQHSVEGGPDVFVVHATPSVKTLRMHAQQRSLGPPGFDVGHLQLIEHDGHGGLRFRERSYVVMRSHAFVDLGSFAIAAATTPRRRDAAAAPDLAPSGSRGQE